MFIEILMLITAIFALFTIFLKNEIYKNFFFLLTLLMMIILIASPFYVSEINECIMPADYYCMRSVYTINVDGSLFDPLLYGFFLLMLLFFIITLIQIIINIAEKIM